MPVLTDHTVAHALCERYRVVDGGDHVILIGLVVAGDHHPAVEPLIYHRRRYSAFNPQLPYGASGPHR